MTNTNEYQIHVLWHMVFSVSDIIFIQTDQMLKPNTIEENTKINVVWTVTEPLFFYQPPEQRK